MFFGSLPAVITPFKDQQAYISKLFSEHDLYPEMLSKLKFRCFTFDSCQGEERDYIYYSFVASSNVDKLWTILPKQLNEQDEEELDRNLRMQRLNVAFSRGKEKLIFVHSKPVSDFSAGREVLNHYAQVIAKAKAVPSESSVDPNSGAEAKGIVVARAAGAGGAGTATVQPFANTTFAEATFAGDSFAKHKLAKATFPETNFAKVKCAKALHVSNVQFAKATFVNTNFDKATFANAKFAKEHVLTIQSPKLILLGLKLLKLNLMKLNVTNLLVRVLLG